MQCVEMHDGLAVSPERLDEVALVDEALTRGVAPRKIRTSG